MSLLATSASLVENLRDATVVVRHPRPSDAAAIHQLVRESGALEANTGYAYLLLCSHFSATSLVAVVGDQLLGFVAAYRPPDHPDAVFVWQIGVAKNARGRGLASILLDRLVSLPACDDVRYLEATVAPSNQASQRLFHRFAERRDVACDVGDGFDSNLFPESGHEAEELYRIGPLSAPHLD